MTNRKGIFAALLVIAVVLAGSSIYAYRTLSAIPEIFKLNEQRKAEGYYMAEFEFKMLGCVYYLDKGEYIKALSSLNAIHHQLATTEGLIKIPAFNNKDEELDFYLERQNPRTGAFMDDSYPLFTYIGATENVIENIETLCQQTGRPLQLKYPLRFLDEIDTPAELEAFLDDLSTQGWIGSQFRSPYVGIAEINSYQEDMARNGLYDLNPEWQEALLQWFYRNQDPQTGYWGPRLKYNGQLIDGGDLVSTEKVIKLFRDAEGRDRYPETMPLRYVPQIITTTLDKLTAPMPQELELQHDWTLAANRGTRIMIRYLWADTSPGDQARIREFIKDIVADKYQQYYINSEGAFSLYSGAEHADLDGTGEVLSYLRLVGCFSGERQKELWQDPELEAVEKSLPDNGVLAAADFAWMGGVADLNTIRLYSGDPGPDYIDNVVCVAYPQPTPVLDRMEMLPALQRWTRVNQQGMGNWVSQGSVAEELSQLKIEEVSVEKSGLPLTLANQTLRATGELTVMAFDVLQTPIYKVIYQQP